ncbi:CRISPR-associated endonuclease Cas2 [uncultured Marinobacter sp.]|jgi:CRISPR-associated protein Cas2|uniref:CRISPR-associated endonuclease Cas2 n=1 Tax=uncultured Marinobacter sp. TaxID=187379 RepID=UPI000C0A1A8A|nr:CRISPR-associated endonuclease Cas2 [Marinobacter sp.]MBI44446.1 CRISPR-associated endonuclease Cas2 [Oceanospirillales bacterium]|tara:strand:+ start:3324 stop:3614 length:291 start_codon:yes stop_codon:yes gene_type:complete
MLVLITYDVKTDTAGGQKRLRRIAKLCQDHGQRVQYSVFECLVDPAQWAYLRNDLIAEMDEEQDSLRFYFLGANWKRRIEHVGAKPAYDPEGPLIL